MEERETIVMEDNVTTEDRGTVRRRLGRGLNALLGGGGAEADSAEPPAQMKTPDDIHVDLIERNPFQPRKDFEPKSLNELVASVKQHGVLQPVLVRSVGETYQLIAGERRWLAARQAGLTTVPCRVLELDDRQVCEVAIEENLKRKDLNVLEKAQAFQDYLERFGSSIEELAKQLSLNRSTVSNYLRLLELCDEVKQALTAEKITNGHARSLLSLDAVQQVALCARIEAESLSVRQTEQAVKTLQQCEPETIPFPEGGAKPSSPEPSNHVVSLQNQLRDLLGAKVQIKLRGKEAGRIVIDFDSNDDFERVVRRLRQAA